MGYEGERYRNRDKRHYICKCGEIVLYKLTAMRDHDRECMLTRVNFPGMEEKKNEAKD